MTNVTVNGSAGSFYADYTFAKDGLSRSDGTNTFTIVATATNQWTNNTVLTNVISANLPSLLAAATGGTAKPRFFFCVCWPNRLEITSPGRAAGGMVLPADRVSLIYFYESICRDR